MTRPWLWSFSRLALLLLLARAAAAQGSPTVVVIVRHAERAAEPADDPPLMAAGVARARAPAAARADANVQAVVTTQRLRSRETARLLADARGLTPETVPTGTLPAHAEAVAAAVRKHAGKTVLVIAHSNTVAPIIAALGGPRMRDLCDSEYSDLFTLVLEGGGARLIRSTYGAPSPQPPTGCAGMMR